MKHTSVFFAILTSCAIGHEIQHDVDDPHHRKQDAAVMVASESMNVAGGVFLVAAQTSAVASTPQQAVPFAAFSPRVKVRWDQDFLYVENNGIPAHGMMKGITAWQQQVPLPQMYSGDNAWRIPLHPVPAGQSIPIKGHFLRGAIALAVNGIPIFNPQNNRGEISKEIGELDDWGGHCGRADDYHYHVAPLHLQDVVGKGKPIAYSLDGYPIYGLAEPDGSPVGNLDECNGHTTKGCGYHYHASLKYPYLNGGFHGAVAEREGQVDPQPRARPVRPDLPPLRGAVITGFTASPDDREFALRYAIGGKQGTVSYGSLGDGSWKFRFVDPNGSSREQTYVAGRQGKGAPPDQTNKPPRPGSGTPLPVNSSPGMKGIVKPEASDTMKVSVYADNWFMLYINGKLVAVDPIDFIPHNVVTVDMLPEYPMTIAVMAKDNADPKTGMEYGNHIGDGGFIIKFADGTVSDATWKAKPFFKGPLNRDVANPKVEHQPLPANWYAVDFDDSQWPNATEFSEQRVNPKQAFYNADFKGAKFIWSPDLDLDNTVVFRTRVVRPGWRPRWNTKPDLDVSGAPLR